MLDVEAPARAACRLVCHRWAVVLSSPGAWPASYSAECLTQRAAALVQGRKALAASWMMRGPFRAKVEPEAVRREIRGERRKNAASAPVPTWTRVGALGGVWLGICPRCGRCSLLERAPAPAAGFLLDCPNHRVRRSVLLCVGTGELDGAREPGKCGKRLSAADGITLQVAGVAQAWKWAGVVVFGEAGNMHHAVGDPAFRDETELRGAACSCCGARPLCAP